MVIAREPRMEWHPNKVSPWERHACTCTSACTAAAAAGSDIQVHDQEVMLPCKPSACMDKGLAHRPRLAGNLDSERRQRLETRSAAMGHRASRSADWRRDVQCRSTLPNLASSATTRRNQLGASTRELDGQRVVLVAVAGTIRGAP